MQPNPVLIGVIRRGNRDRDTHRKKTTWRHKEEKAAIYKPRTESSEETTLADTRHLDLTLLAPEWWKNKFLLLKSPILWYFVMVALATNTVINLQNLYYLYWYLGSAILNMLAWDWKDSILFWTWVLITKPTGKWSITLTSITDLHYYKELKFFLHNRDKEKDVKLGRSHWGMSLGIYAFK